MKEKLLKANRIKNVIILVGKMVLVVLLAAIVWNQMINWELVDHTISKWVPALCVGICSVGFEEIRRYQEKKNK